MTRKRFWGLRNALHVKLDEWGKENGYVVNGVGYKKARPVSGKPLLNFEKGKELGIGTSYDEAWNCKAVKDLRKSLGMEA